MPLITTGKPGVPDEARRAIGFWMEEVGGTKPPQFISSCVTCGYLEAIDTSQPPAWDVAFEIFTKNRAQIEAVASNKFDKKEGVEDGTYEGRPILTVDSDD